MKTQWVGQAKFIGTDDGRYFLENEESCDAITQLEWAQGMLLKPDVVYPNGVHSHHAANKVAELAENTLIKYQVFF